MTVAVKETTDEVRCPPIKPQPYPPLGLLSVSPPSPVPPLCRTHVKFDFTRKAFGPPPKAFSLLGPFTKNFLRTALPQPPINATGKLPCDFSRDV